MVPHEYRVSIQFSVFEEDENLLTIEMNELRRQLLCNILLPTAERRRMVLGSDTLVRGCSYITQSFAH